MTQIDVKTALITGEINDDEEIFGFSVMVVDGSFTLRISHNGNSFLMDDDGWMTTDPTDDGPKYTMPGERYLALEDEVIAMLDNTSIIKAFGWKVDS